MGRVTNVQIDTDFLKILFISTDVFISCKSSYYYKLYSENGLSVKCNFKIKKRIYTGLT